MGNKPSEIVKDTSHRTLQHSEELLLKAQKAEQNGSKENAAEYYFTLGKVYESSGDFKTAIVNFEKASRLEKELCDKSKELKCYMCLGAAHLKMGNFDQAKQYYQESVILAREIGDKVSESECEAEFRSAISVHYKLGARKKGKPPELRLDLEASRKTESKCQRSEEGEESREVADEDIPDASVGAQLDDAEELSYRKPTKSIQEEELSDDHAFNLNPSSPPSKRYADYTFRPINSFSSIPGDPLQQGYALKCDSWYQLEVAIRNQPIGIPTKESERTEIIDPGRSTDITIYAAVTSSEFEIKEPVQTILLPPIGNSIKNAEFRVRPIKASASENDMASIEVRLYFEFNLLEATVIEAEVVDRFQNEKKSNFGFEKPIFLKQQRIEREIKNFEDIIPRSMHIDITRRAGLYLFRFLLRNETSQEIIFDAPLGLSATDLGDDLATIRTILHDMTLSTFDRQLSGDDSTIRSVRRLARAGYNLRTKLFNLNIDSSLHRIGQFLQEHPIKNDGIIQITVEKEAADFVFPWSILYDIRLPAESSELPEEAIQFPNPEGFWGIRYSIEQHLPNESIGSDAPDEVLKRLKVGFMLNSTLPNTANQKKLFDTLVNQCKGKLEVTSPITTRVECENLLQKCDANILYFYCHGNTRSPKTEMGIPDFDTFSQLMEKLDKNNPTYKKLTNVYEEIKTGRYEKQSSWILLTTGRIILEELYCSIEEPFQTRPTVILNMCESAEVTPSLSESFIHFFIDRGAQSVIGTECPMTTTFAHPFGELLLTSILKGEQIGKAVLDARRHFLKEQKNPLGLAYTLFGSATTRFEPKLIAAESS